MNPDSPVRFCASVSSLALVAGALSMAISLMSLFGSRAEEISAGGYGFVAGTVLVAAGLVSLTMIATRSAA